MCSVSEDYRRLFVLLIFVERPSWLWSYGSWIYNCLCSRCLSPLILWVWILIRARCTTLCDKICQWFPTDQLFSPIPPVSTPNKIYLHYITEICLKAALNTTKQTNKQIYVELLTHHCLNFYFMVVFFSKISNLCADQQIMKARLMGKILLCWSFSPLSDFWYY